MKSTIIADTSGLISLVSVTDSNHAKALATGKKLSAVSGSLIVPSDVYSETLNIAGKKLGHMSAIGTAEMLFANNTFLVADSTEKIRDRAFELFKKQPESVSFTDCVVMATADHFNTKNIFGFDETFRKNGYLRVGVDEK